MAQTIKLTQDGAANALALNREFNQAVIGGRNVFKIFSIEDSEFIETLNLRVGKNLNLNFSCNDVAWNTGDDYILATAATNGAVVIWNLMKPTRSKLEHVFNDHKRTVNKVCFKPTEQSLLLSGSQDGTLKCFDLRIRDVVRTFVSGSESVRDVQFSPHHSSMFTSVSENGNVEMWDLRRPDRYSLQFTAHSGPIFACDWHAEMRWLATASRDKTIKVWDMEMKPTLEFTIHTIASIGHIKWRPSRRHHIASSALVMDCNVNVWDIRRPYIPFASFDHHKDVATGVVWRGSPHVFLTTSRDGQLVQNVFSDCKRPADSANPQAVSISGKGDILVASRQSSFPRRPLNEQFLNVHSAVRTYTPTDSQETDAFVECAQHNQLTGRSLAEMCDANAAVARRAKLGHVALVWETIKVIYTYTPNIPEDSFFHRPDDIIILSEGKNVPKSIQGVAGTSMGQVMSSCDASEVKSVRGLDLSGMEEETDLDEADFLHGLRPPDVPAQGDFFFGDGEVDPLGADQLETVSKCQIDWTMRQEAFVPRHEIIEGAPPDNYGEAIETAPSTENTSTALTVHTLPTVLPMNFCDVVVKALWYHVDNGDVQTAVAVLAVLGDRRKDLDLSLMTQANWLLSYIDLLSRHRLFEQSAELIKSAWLPEISQMSQHSTTVYAVCGSCNKGFGRSGWLCDRCKQTTTCSLCHQVVRGLLAWCQGCSHGGHPNHLRGWFADNTLCPTGCGHECEFD